MPKVRLDRVILSNLHESFKNHKTVTDQIVISGTIPNGGRKFSAFVPLDRTNAVAEIYIKKSTNDYKRSTDNLQRLTEYGGSTFAYVSTNYTSEVVTVTIEVVNFGSSYTAPDETYDVEVVLFDVPL